LRGQTLPDVVLESTGGMPVNPKDMRGLSVWFCHPYIGKPGVPDPEGWDNIPGAHGSTPQALGYSALADEFQRHGVSVFGLSFQDTAWQRDFAARNGLRIPLVSDHAREFAVALGLSTFMAGQYSFLTRATLIAQSAEIVAVRSAIADPARDGEETLSLVRSLA
jgi:peroxiredoxin